MFQGEDDMQVINPVFRTQLTMIRYLPWVVILMICMGIVSDGDKYLILSSLLLASLFYPFRHWYVRGVYKNTTFEISDNTIKDKTNFLVLYFREIDFKNIKEVKISQSLLQKCFGLGNLTLHTQATSSGGNADSGMTLMDISDVENTYRLIKEKL